MRELTPKQEAFSQYVADGLTKSEAYRRVYLKNPGKTPVNVAKDTAKVMAMPLVAARIKQLQDENKAMEGLSRAEKRRILAQQARDRDMAPEHRRAAIQADNLMTGDNKPIKVEGEITLGSILREIAPTTGLPSQDKPR